MKLLKMKLKMLHYTKFFLCFLLLLSCNENKQINTAPDYKIYKKDSTKVTKLAEAVWLQYFGKEIYKKKPFKAKIKDAIWTVSGTLNNSLGGVPYVQINAKNFEIIKIWHGK